MGGGLQVLLAGGALFGAAVLATGALRRRSAALRSAVWSATTGTVLILPLLVAGLPRWELAVMPPSPEPVAAERVTSAAPPEPSVIAGRRGPARGADDTPVPPEPAAPETEVFSGAEVSRGEAASRYPVSADGIGSVIGWWSLAGAGAWLAGAALLLGGLALGLRRIRGIERRAVAIRDPRLRRSYARVRRRLGVRGYVGLLQTDELQVPVTWHLLAPVILVPRRMTGWSSERQEAVLAHELAHVRRRDGPMQLLAQVVTALHWPDPFAWLAAAAWRRDREIACDDDVVASGIRPSSYAGHLVAIASGLPRQDRHLVPGLSATRGSCLAARVRSILDSRTRRRSPDRRTLVSIIALTLTLALPVAALQPAPAVSPPAEEAGDPGAGTTTVSSPEGRPAQEPSPTVDELIKMRIHGVTPEYVAGMRQILGESLEVDDLVSLRIHGATPELAAGLRAAVGDLGADGLVKAQIHGATAEFAAEMTRLLDTELEIDDLVKMRIHGVSPELVEELREAGYAGLTVEELVKIRIHGIDRILKKRRVRERQGGGR